MNLNEALDPFKKKKVIILLVVCSVILLSSIIAINLIENYFEKINQEKYLAQFPKSWIHQKNGYISIEPPSACPFNSEICDVKIIPEFINLQTNDTLPHGLDVLYFVKQIGNVYTYVGENNDTFTLIPNYDGIVYVMVNKTGPVSVDPIPTFVQNPIFQCHSYEDLVGFGNKAWVFTANLTQTNFKWEYRDNAWTTTITIYGMIEPHDNFNDMPDGPNCPIGDSK